MGARGSVRHLRSRRCQIRLETYIVDCYGELAEMGSSSSEQVFFTGMIVGRSSRSPPSERVTCRER